MKGAARAAASGSAALPVQRSAVLGALLGFALMADASRAATPERAFAAPSFTTTSIVSYDRKKVPCDSPECAQKRLTSESTVRLTGEFGRFTGKLDRWAPDSLAGFDTDPDWAGAAPARAVHWSEVSRVDVRANNVGRGATVGAASGALLGLVIAASAQSVSSPFTTANGSSDGSVTLTYLGAATGGALIGAGLGALIGSVSHRWVSLYERPAASGGAPR